MSELSPEDAQSIRLRTGCVIPESSSGLVAANDADRPAMDEAEEIAMQLEELMEPVRPGKRKAEEFERDFAEDEADGDADSGTGSEGP